MNKRDFIKKSSVLTAATIAYPLMTSCESKSSSSTVADGLGFTLPELGYSFDALEPHIDAKTMEIHHGKHHAGYVRKLNVALEGSAHVGKNLKELLADISPTESGVRNNGGGHYNHSLFWSVLSPNAGGAPSGKVSDAINAAFGDYDSFKEAFSKAAVTRFGSGWAWLCQDASGQLFVSSTANQDNPLMTNIVEKTGTPLLGLDVWEHAYYLKYQNRRGEYVDNFFQLINWDEVARRMS